jgi:diacylglycerol kinase family enzyme
VLGFPITPLLHHSIPLLHAIRNPQSAIPLNPADTPCLIFNPSAQGGKARRFHSHPALPRGQCVFLATAAPGDARRLAAQAVRDGFQTIIAAGGDGTANEVLNGIADVPGGFRAVRLGILPLGTINVFARELGLPLHARRAWKVLALGRERTIDVGRAEFTLGGTPQRRYFMQLAGAGVDSRAIELTDWNVKKKIGFLAYVVAGFKALSEKRPLITVRTGETGAGGRVDVASALCADGPAPSKGETSTGEWVGVGNGRFYGGPIPVFPRARLDDGLLHVCVLPKANFVRLAAVVAGLLMGRMHQFCRARQLCTTALTLTSPARVLLQLDGENAGELPATLTVEPRALRVLVP